MLVSNKEHRSPLNLFDRIYQLHTLLASARRPVPLRRLMEEMECSKATAKRTIRDMRLHLGAPIEYDRDYNGYHYDPRAEHPYELPGLWFNGSELYALLATQKLLSGVQPGLLEAHLEPLRQRIEALLETRHATGGNVAERIRILRMAARPPGRQFGTIAGALLQRRRIAIRYHARSDDQTTERVVSPQRLIHYRDNWYLEAWCHERGGPRNFSVERIVEAHPMDEPAQEMSEEALDQHFATAYGIFAGHPRHRAVLRFTPERARWVAEEQWHPKQEGRHLKDGSYELRIPYADPRELIMDILKYGPDVEVLAPASLRRQVAERLRAAIAQYE